MLLLFQTRHTGRQKITVDAGEVSSTLGGARSDPLQCARVGSLQEEGGLQSFVKLVAELGQQGESSGVCLGNLVIATTSCPEHNCMYQQSHHSFPIPLKYVDVVRKTRTNLDTLEKSSIDDLLNN